MKESIWEEEKRQESVRKVCSWGGRGDGRGKCERDDGVKKRRGRGVWRKC